MTNDPYGLSHPLELWGGHECTVNRVHTNFYDQTRATGHESRSSDLDHFADLGLTALRYPILWERVAPERPDSCDWRWTDERLARLRALGIRPIAGLVHHGSGPRYTDLLDPGFAPGLARFAKAAAERYDWVEDWTPINEPVTTARFSALYGHWYPHQRDERAFWIALLNQIDAVRLSMRAIRRVNPGARLIQTDDLGRTWATVPLRHQAGFDNLRRWMGWDLLCGRVTSMHPLFERLVGMGLGDRLREIGDDPCPPAVIGVNHYLTSDRFLDHRLRRYPPEAAGGNGQQQFADVAAVRVLQPGPTGLGGALREAWDRYGIPVAATEVHNGCTRDEQLRWMAEAWSTANALRAEGVAVTAVTSWALLGNQGWDRLLTEPGRYETGAFDVRGAGPRATALAPMLAAMGSGRPLERNAPATGSGWWRRPVRLVHPAEARPAALRAWMLASQPAAPQPILICGATGTLGQALARACAHRDIACIVTGRADLDLTERDSIAQALERHRPWAVINAAGWVRVDDAETRVRDCFSANTKGAALLATLCDEAGLPSVSFSSDLVFDGTKQTPYVEGDPVRPLNVYGQSKADAEQAIAALSGDHLIVRTAAFFSPDDCHNFAVHLVAALLARKPFPVVADEIVSPTYVPHLCDAVLDLLIDGATGIWHLSNGTALSWLEFAHRVAGGCGLDPSLIRAADPHASRPARRPSFAALASARGELLPPLGHAIGDFAEKMFEIAARSARAEQVTG